MPVVRPQWLGPRGELLSVAYDSRVLRKNPWGDPSRRQVLVYQPAGFGADDGPLPTLWDLAAYTNSGPGHVSWRNHGENLPQRLDRLIGEEKMPPVRVVLPDCYTSLGGNQYVNSSAVGDYHRYLVEELVPLVDHRFNTVAAARGRALFGKSSGGYGALMLAMREPEVFSAAACHAPDVNFDLVYRPDFPKVCTLLADYQYDIAAFIEAFWRKKRPTGMDFHVMMILCMAASYDPDPESELGFELPFDLYSCVLDPKRWSRWLAHDPLQAADRHADALRDLRGLYIDVGRRDQYHIQYGCRQLHRKLQKLAVEHHYQEFDGSHSGIDYRLDLSLPFLARCLLVETAAGD